MEIAEVLNYLTWIETIAGIVWIFLTGLTVVATFKVYMEEGNKSTTFRLGLLLVTIVWLYPAYAGFVGSVLLGEIGTLITLSLTVGYFVKLRKISGKLSRLMIPQTVWLSLASIYLGLQLAV